MASYTYRYNEHGAVVVDGRACPPLTAEFATQRAAEVCHRVLEPQTGRPLV